MAEEKHKLAEIDYMKGMKYKEIAEKYSTTLNTVKSWKQRYGWDRKSSKKGAPNKKGAHPNSIKLLGNKNATGPPGNRNALKHGMYSRYIPKETLEIMGMIEKLDPVDLLWDNICIAYAAIIRAQKIMEVKAREELIKYVKKEGAEFTEYELQFAWDRQANFLQAQSRAMREMTNMISKYDELCRSGIATEEQLLRIKKLKGDINRMEGDTEQLQRLDEILRGVDAQAKEGD